MVYCPEQPSNGLLRHLIQTQQLSERQDGKVVSIGVGTKIEHNTLGSLMFVHALSLPPKQMSKLEYDVVPGVVNFSDMSCFLYGPAHPSCVNLKDEK